MYIKYIIPLYYTYFSRLKTRTKKIGYIFTFIIPILIVSVLISDNFNLFHFILGLLGFMSIYEIGYLRNDILTVKKEKSPTLRLSSEDHKIVEKYLKKIFFYKYIITILVIIYLSFFVINNVILYIISILLIEFFYFIHNIIRNRWNLLSFTVLNNLRYSTVVLLFSDEFLFVHILFLITISLLRLLEKASENKYNFKLLQTLFKRSSNIRTFYYFLILVIVYILFPSFHLYLIITTYFFVYRLLISIVEIIFKKR